MDKNLTTPPADMQKSWTTCAKNTLSQQDPSKGQSASKCLHSALWVGFQSLVWHSLLQTPPTQDSQQLITQKLDAGQWRIWDISEVFVPIFLLQPRDCAKPCIHQNQKWACKSRPSWNMCNVVASYCGFAAQRIKPCKWFNPEWPSNPAVPDPERRGETGNTKLPEKTVV